MKVDRCKTGADRISHARQPGQPRFGSVSGRLADHWHRRDFAKDCPGDYEYLATAGDVDSFGMKLQHALDHPDRWSFAIKKAARLARDRFDLAAARDAYDALYREALNGHYARIFCDRDKRVPAVS